MSETGLSTPLLGLDEGFVVWTHYDVFSQPAAVLLRADGSLIQELDGRFSAEAVLALL